MRFGELDVNEIAHSPRIYQCLSVYRLSSKHQCDKNFLCGQRAMIGTHRKSVLGRWMSGTRGPQMARLAAVETKMILDPPFSFLR